MPTTPPHDGRGTGRAPALSAKSRGRPPAPPGRAGGPRDLKATPRRRRHRPHPRRHDRHRDLGDDGIGIELRHLAIALPASAVTSVVGYLT
jgi:hypothetical protein